MNQRTNRGAGFLYAMAAGVVISVYVPFLIGIVSNDERKHDYDGPAMMISKGMGMLGLILGGHSADASAPSLEENGLPGICQGGKRF